MIKLYELLAKVGSNPKLRAWAMEQLINLKKLKPSYKKSFSHKMDLNKVKDIRNPNWLTEEITKAKGYDLKNKVVDIAKAKHKVRWNKVDKQRDKDKFYGVTGQAQTAINKMKDDVMAFEKQIAKDDAWFNKLMKAKVKGDPRAIKILNDYFKKKDKDFVDKIIPFKPKKAEGGIITVSDPGMGEGPFMMEEFLEAVKQGFKGTYDEYIDQIDRSPRDYLAEGGPTQKEIDKGIAAIEKLKSSLMPESYEELIKIYKDKQKDLNIDIMESAGGLGEMLGEGGRVGMQGGGWPGMLAWLAQQGPKVWKWMNKPGNNPYDLYKKYLKSVKERSIKGDMKSLAPELGAITAGGIMANRWASKKLKEAANLDRLNFAEEQIEELKKDQFYSERPELLEERINEIREDATRERKWWDKGGFNDGGRVGMMYGGDPGFAFSYGGSWADWKDNHASEMPLMDYINQKLPKARHPFSNGGEIEISWEEVFAKHMQGQPLTDEERKILGQVPTEDKAEGGRIGMQLGGPLMTRGIMQALKILREGWGLTSSKGKLHAWPGTFDKTKTMMNKFKDKFGDAKSFAAMKGKILKTQLENDIKGYKDLINNYKKDYSKWELDDFKETINAIKKDIKLVDKYILKSQSKKATKHAEGGRIGMAKGDTPSEAYLRDLYYDGGWDDRGDIGLHEFMHGPIGWKAWQDYIGKAEGGRIGFKKGSKKGGIGDLLGEMYRLFEISPLLASPELMDVIQKIPFDKGGRVGFEKGGKSWWNNPMTRRTFGKLGIMGALTSLGMKFGPKIAKTKPVKDISVKLKSWIDDSDEMTEWGPQAVGRAAGNFDISSLTPKGIAILKNLFGKSVKTVKDKKGKITASMDDVGTEDAAMYVDDIIKKGKGVIDFKYVDDIIGGTGSIDATLARYAQTFGKNSKAYKDLLKKSKKMTEKQKVQYELDASGMEDEWVDDVIGLIYPRKAEGGSVGQPPIQLGPLDLTPRASGGFTQGQPYGANTREKTWSDNIGISGMLDLPGGFSLTGEYDKYRTKDRLYTVDDVYLDERVKDDHDRWRLGLQWKKKFAKGGKAWRPKSAPKLTTTIPPERGPTPQGLTYLTGDDIVQNIG